MRIGLEKSIMMENRFTIRKEYLMKKMNHNYNILQENKLVTK